ncbi:hypothetical protein DUNSADRAFT_433 [Dunaliella salina]|uniref:Encoded protein n=1 Tax=Dunaliella salina TaxID=3046 RepID=A0ABQ7FYY0_DUNSA|nr:hypothetical protein DUNSADRAFT_433 [Dunaliella salina]|eukprot:KAF5827566.1 hypothetical protein DUNSADRAFT_433 [Dunaliella salina]
MSDGKGNRINAIDRPAHNLPKKVKVECGTIQGYLLTDTAVLRKKKGKPFIDVDFVQLKNGKETGEHMNGSEFERIAGRGAAKTWRETVKVIVQDSGPAGKPDKKKAGVWLKEHAACWGFDMSPDTSYVPAPQKNKMACVHSSKQGRSPKAQREEQKQKEV